MSEVNIAASPAATVVAGFLVSADPPPRCAVYRGVLTPTELDARPREIEALVARAAFRADVGYVTIAAPAESLPVLETLVLEAVKRPLEDVFEAAGRAKALKSGWVLYRFRARLNEGHPLMQRRPSRDALYS